MDEQKKAPASKGTDAEENKMQGILAYIGLLVFIPVLTAKESEFAQFHANQGLIVLIAGFAAGVVGAIPIVGLITIPVSLGLFVFSIMGIINAVNGEMKELPFIGHFKILK